MKTELGQTCQHSLVRFNTTSPLFQLHNKPVIPTVVQGVTTTTNLSFSSKAEVGTFATMKVAIELVTYGLTVRRSTS